MLLGLWEIILVSLIAILNIGLGILVYTKNPAKKSNQFFLLLSISLLIWLLGAFISEIPKNLKHSLFLSRLTYLGVLLSATFLFYFSFYFPREKILKRGLKQFVISISAIFCFLNISSDLIIKDITSIPPGGFNLIFGKLYILYLIFCIILAFSALRNFLQSFKKTLGIERLQLQYLFLGLIIFIGTSIIVNTIVRTIVGSDAYYRIGNYSLIFFIILTAFAIIKYHLFEIRVILTELLVGAMGIILLILPFVMPSFGLRILTGLIFLLFLIFAYYLVKATHGESKRREEIEKLAFQERTLREKAEKVAKEFERISNIKDQMLLSSQHYWRTPLTGMKGFLDMILTGDYGELSPALKEKLVIIQKLSQTLHQRIEESIDITQFQIGKGMLNKEETQIEDFLNGVLEEFKPQLEERRLYLKTQFPKEKLPKAMIDQKRMRETYSNVIDNAIKHTIKGGITIVSKFMPHGLKLNQPSILCLVKDTGIGIPKEELSSIGTSPFERGEEAKKLSPMGKGVGLYLSRLIVEAHGGKLWIESEGKDKGTTIYIELPLSDNKEESKKQ